jgi:YVTN family beta-propeller protein
MRITTAVRAENGKPLMNNVLACTTVGSDVLGPEVMRTPPPLNAPVISPGGGDTDVDPLTTIRVSFTESVQPLSIGHLEDGEPPVLGSAVLLQFGPDATRTTVPFSVRPLSPFDLSTYDLIPAFHFPGSGPQGGECGTFSKVDIQVQAGQVADLADNGSDPTIPLPNFNLLEPSTSFTTGEGPGLVNAPVSPDTIYVGRQGSSPGMSVIDLNGFGQSTGNPVYDETYQSFEEGNTYFPINPNVRFQGSQLRPALAPGTCTIDGGSAGVFTLTPDSSLNDLVIRPPVMRGVSDMAIGHALDGTFNNGPFPFGCQSGGGNLCALDGLKIINPVVAGNTLQPAQAGQFGTLGAGAENLISWSPHPNPPPFVFPPLCVAPYLGTQEPTSVDVDIQSPIFPLPNLLGPADPFGDPVNGVPPTGLLSPEQNTYFMGPSIPQQQIAACQTHMLRQQIGHYIYAIDRVRGEVTVLNSNRMTVVDRIIVPDPTSLAMGTNVDFLAITNQLANVVSFVDIDPASASFHQIVKNVVVGSGPRGIAWEPDNEDILVCNEASNSVSIISTFSLDVRKTITSQLQGPFEIAITPRQMGFGWARQVYFAYILNRSGKIAMYESGPNSVNGWGYDDVIGVTEFDFRNPKTIQPDHVRLDSMVWVVHEGPINEAGDPGDFGVGAVSNLVIESALVGPLPLNVSSLSIPQYRDMSMAVRTSIGQDQGISGLTGVPVDIAFDNQRNLGGLTNFHNTFSAGAPVPLNGKNLIRVVAGVIVNASEPQFMFIAVPNSTGGSGVVDVFDFAAAGSTRVDTNPFQFGTQSIEASNATVLCDYWRQ